MEAATKNKRGRPRSIKRRVIDNMPGLWEDKTIRGAMNEYYAATCIIEIAEAQKGQESFFATARGSFRRRGIAEQIGRIYDAELLTKDQCKELLEIVIADYESGSSVKEIESELRAFRKMLQS